MEIKVINLMSYIFSNNVILIVNLMISITVHLPLRGCPLRCYFAISIYLLIISTTNEREGLFNCGGFLDRQIGMEPLVID